MPQERGVRRGDYGECLCLLFILFLFSAAANFDLRFVDVIILDQTLSKCSGECHKIMQVELMRCIAVPQEVPLGRGIDGEHLYSWGD